MSSEMWWCKCIALNDAATRIRKFRKFCVHVKLAEVDQTFTAKDLGRGVTPVVLVVLAVPVLVPVPVPVYI